MSKLTKKQIKQTEKQIIASLTQVCHQAQVKVKGFEWLTHLVDYDNLTKSLIIVCIFDSQENLKKAEDNQMLNQMNMWIVASLAKLNIRLHKPASQIRFDSEQACNEQHQGNWERRLTMNH